MGVVDRVRAAGAALTARRRQVWAGEERAHIEIRDLTAAEVDGFIVALEDDLLCRDGVQWVQLYPQLGMVVVAFDAEALPLDEVVATVEETERVLGLDGRPFASTGVSHPADLDRLVREAARLGSDLIGVGIGITGRLLIPSPGQVRAVLGSVAAVVNGVPRVRAAVCRRFDWALTDFGLSAVSSFTQGLAAGPLGPFTDLVHHLSGFAETLSRRGTWLALEGELFAKPEMADLTLRELPPPRPGPLPDGPVERFENRVWPASFSAAGVAFLALRDPRRASAVMEAAIPKGALYGKEAFAAHLGRALAARRVVVRDERSLRVLDRVDSLVVEGSLLDSGEVGLGEIFLTGDDDRDETTRRVRSLFDPTTGRVVRRGAWRLGPVSRLRVDPTDRVRDRIAALAGDDETVLGLARDRQLRALVRTRPVLTPEGQDLLVIARRAGVDVMVALPPGGGVPAEVDRCLPAGKQLVEAVRAVQAEGRVVCVVGTSDAALAVADCAIGVRCPGQPTPWAAHILCPDGLRQACLVVEACADARGMSAFATRVSAVASGAAGVLALRPLPGALLRTGTVINGAALFTMAEGTRRAVALQRRPRPLPRDPTPWHALDPEVALERFSSSPDGLSEDEAARRLPEPTRPLPAPVRLGRDVAGEMVSPLTPVLGVGAVLSLVTGAPLDAAMVTAVVALNAVIGGVQRFRAAEAFSRLERRGELTATVRRAGQETRIDAGLVVPGDVLHLRAGDAVVADCRIVEAGWLEVDESSLTGESFTVVKHPDPVVTATVAERTSMVYDGTFVAAGEALAVAVATGGATEARRAVLAGQGPPETGVEARLRRLTDLTIPVALGAGAVTMAVGLLRRQPFSGLAAGAVSLAVAAVPEGLPLLSGVAQLSAARRLAERGVLVRNSRAVEALGRVDVMCVDKTGTLTKGKLALALVAPAGAADEDPAGLSSRGRFVVATALRATPEPAEGRKLPHPTDRAVARGAADAGIEPDEGASGWRRLDELPFEPARGYHATVGGCRQRRFIDVKGAPEIVLPRCATWLAGDGDRNLGPAARAALDRQLRRLTRRGLRVLAVARGPAPPSLDDDHIKHLAFVGFVAISDPVRPSAIQAVRDLADAGVEMVMITGDHPSTAEGIAAELGLLNDAPTVTGGELDELDDVALADRVRHARVFARVTPAHKVRIVRAFQQAGRVVAMTGDGANDAPAIRLADVGIAVGKRATPAAREAADLVSPRNRLEVLVSAVAEGRGMWVSVRDAVALLVGANLGEIGFTVGGTLLGGQAPLGARQLLLVNLLTDVAPAMAIAVQPPSTRSFADLLREGPEASLGAPLNRAILLRAACTGAAATGAWLIGRVTGPPSRARTIGFAALVGAELGQTLVATRPRPTTLAASVGSAALLVAVIQTPGVSHLFGCTPLDPLGWGTAVAASAAATGAAVVLPRLATVRPRASSPAVPSRSISEMEPAPLALPKPKAPISAAAATGA